MVRGRLQGDANNNDEEDVLMPNEELQDEVEPIDSSLAEPIDLPTEPTGVERLPDSFPEKAVLATPQKNEKKNEKPGFDVEETHKTEEASGNTVANDELLLTPINPREPFTKWKFPTLDLLKQYDSDNRTNYVSQEELEANKDRIIKVLNASAYR